MCPQHPDKSIYPAYVIKDYLIIIYFIINYSEENTRRRIRPARSRSEHQQNTPTETGHYCQG